MSVVSYISTTSGVRINARLALFMDNLLAIGLGTGIRIVVDSVSRHDLKLAGTLIGLWEGVVMMHFIQKTPRSFDPYLAFGTRLAIDWLLNEDVWRLMLVLLWTGMGMILTDIGPALWKQTGLHRVWRTLRKDVTYISRSMPEVTIPDFQFPEFKLPSSRSVRFMSSSSKRRRTSGEASSARSPISGTSSFTRARTVQISDSPTTSLLSSPPAKPPLAPGRQWARKAPGAFETETETETASRSTLTRQQRGFTQPGTSQNATFAFHRVPSRDSDSTDDASSDDYATTPNAADIPEIPMEQFSREIKIKKDDFPPTPTDSVPPLDFLRQQQVRQEAYIRVPTSMPTIPDDIPVSRSASKGKRPAVSSRDTTPVPERSTSRQATPIPDRFSSRQATPTQETPLPPPKDTKGKGRAIPKLKTTTMSQAKAFVEPTTEMNNLVNITSTYATPAAIPSPVPIVEEVVPAMPIPRPATGSFADVRISTGSAPPPYMDPFDEPLSKTLAELGANDEDEKKAATEYDDVKSRLDDEPVILAPLQPDPVSPMRKTASPEPIARVSRAGSIAPSDIGAPVSRAGSRPPTEVGSRIPRASSIKPASEVAGVASGAASKAVSEAAEPRSRSASKPRAETVPSSRAASVVPADIPIPPSRAGSRPPTEIGAPTVISRPGSTRPIVDASAPGSRSGSRPPTEVSASVPVPAPVVRPAAELFASHSGAPPTPEPEPEAEVAAAEEEEAPPASSAASDFNMDVTNVDRINQGLEFRRRAIDFDRMIKDGIADQEELAIVERKKAKFIRRAEKSFMIGAFIFYSVAGVYS